MNEPTVITAPSVEPVTLADARTAIAIDSAGSQDKLLSTYISAARRYFEWRTGRTVHQTTYEWTLNKFPSTSCQLPRATPLISITSVKYKDSSAVETTLAASEYIADIDSTPGRLVLGYNKSWPSFTAYPSNPIRIRYVAGIATASPVTAADQDIQLPILLLVAAMYENPTGLLASDRGAVSQLAVQYGIEHYLSKLQVEYVY